MVGEPQQLTEKKAAARAFVQGTKYTDARVAELQASLRELRVQRYRDNRKSMKQRFALHALLILFGVGISVALIAYAASPVLLALITGGPSVITEIVDYVKRF
jgi:hypothetical protein